MQREVYMTALNCVRKSGHNNSVIDTGVRPSLPYGLPETHRVRKESPKTQKYGSIEPVRSGAMHSTFRWNHLFVLCTKSDHNKNIIWSAKNLKPKVTKVKRESLQIFPPHHLLSGHSR